MGIKAGLAQRHRRHRTLTKEDRRVAKAKTVLDWPLKGQGLELAFLSGETLISLSLLYLQTAELDLK